MFDVIAYSDFPAPARRDFSALYQAVKVCLADGVAVRYPLNGVSADYAERRAWNYAHGMGFRIQCRAKDGVLYIRRRDAASN